MPLQSWLVPNTTRVFPSSAPGRGGRARLAAARAERASFQVALRWEGDGARRVAVAVDAPRGLTCRVRRVGYVPLRRLSATCAAEDVGVDRSGPLPGWVGDPLLEEAAWILPRQEAHAAWITVQVGERCAPGPQELVVRVQADGQRERRHRVVVDVAELRLPPRRAFTVTHWFYADALMDRYGTDGFDERFWSVCARYLDDYAAHGNDCILTPLLTPPLDDVKRPTQLLGVSRDRNRYRFDWSLVERWVDAARTAGIRRFEWSHFFTQWGARHAIRVYEGRGEDESRLLWPPETPATDPVYRAFLAQLLPELHRFLGERKLLRDSCFHVSDEPHGAEQRKAYADAREMLRDLAPWMQVMDALSEPEFAAVTDLPVASIHRIADFHAAGIPCWSYYCCWPRGPWLNRLLDTPLATVAMHGVLLYRHGGGGFLHWGYNYWYEHKTRRMVDPYLVTDCGERLPAGDGHVVYPGADGPVSSVRWELFAEALQDYRLLQARGVERDHPLLAGVRGFDEFPRDPAWRAKLRRRLLR